jgi:hypothetical protein
MTASGIRVRSLVGPPQALRRPGNRWRACRQGGVPGSTLPTAAQSFNQRSQMTFTCMYCRFTYEERAARIVSVRFVWQVTA